MLRLWPETIEICLFPGVAWRQTTRIAPRAIVSAESVNPAAMLDQLRVLLDAQSPPLQTRSRISLTVSDTLANIVAMPWQGELRRPAEVEAYANACFQHIGLTVSDGWTMHAEFREFNAMGMAYALPDAWLDALLAELTKRNLVLESVLPLSAAIYFGGKAGRGEWPAVVVAREYSRIAALVFGPSGLIGYDVETIIGSAEDSARRLEGRLVSQHGASARQLAWNATKRDAEDATALGRQQWRTAS